jgi:hypothetical protein
MREFFPALALSVFNEISIQDQIVGASSKVQVKHKTILENFITSSALFAVFAQI